MRTFFSRPVLQSIANCNTGITTFNTYVLPVELKRTYEYNMVAKNKPWTKALAGSNKSGFCNSAFNETPCCNDDIVV